jgi:hypothetical protein
MAGQFGVFTGSVTLLIGVPKTLIELPTNSSASLIVVYMELSSEETKAGDVMIEWGTYSSAGTGTAFTPVKFGANQGPAANTGTVQVNNSAEPSGFAVGTGWSMIMPIPGSYSMLYPQGREPYQPPSTLRAFRATATCPLCTTPASLVVRFDIVFEQ